MLNTYEYKATVGKPYTFVWFAPKPLEVGSTPTMEVRFPSGSTAPVLAHLHSEVATSAMSRDRTTLTAPTATAASSRGMQGAYGAGFLITESDGPYAVKIRKVVDGFIHLANPLPHGVEGVGVVQWAAWYTTIPAVASATRSVPFSIAYQEQYGLDIPTSGLVYEGLVHFVRAPFATGLNTTSLVNAYPQLGTLADHANQGFDTQIALTHVELESMLRAELVSSALTEDEVHGPSLLAAHAALTAATVYQLTDTEKAGVLRVRAKELVDLTLRSVWIDADKDGEVNEEDVTAVTGGRPVDVSGNYTDSTSTRIFGFGDANR